MEAAVAATAPGQKEKEAAVERARGDGAAGVGRAGPVRRRRWKQDWWRR